MEYNAEVTVLADPEALAREAAQHFAELARESAASRGRFSVALSGGSSPGKLYELLATEPYRARIPWDQVHLFWGDERCVAAHDAGSNYHQVAEALISRVPIPAENVHRMRGELEPEAAARAYDRELQDFFCGPRSRFDLVLLGLGEDGHTASLFPGSPLLDEAERLVAPAVAVYQDRPARRLTLTLPAINTARQVLFLVSGSAKAQIVQAVIEGPAGLLPAQRIQPTAGRLTWLLDAAAASALEGRALDSIDSVIKAVIFDFGRVISAQKPMSLFRGYEKELGLAPGTLNRVMFGNEGWEQVLVGRKALDDYWLEIGPELGLNTPEQIQAFRRRYFADEAINEGVLELIQRLQGRYKLAILSNAPPRLDQWLAEWEILDLFDVVVCSGDEGVAKPDPAIFELVLARLGVAAGESIFIDDSPGHVAAARALGLEAIHFTTAEALATQLDALLGPEM